MRKDLKITVRVESGMIALAMRTGEINERTACAFVCEAIESHVRSILGSDDEIWEMVKAHPVMVRRMEVLEARKRSKALSIGVRFKRDRDREIARAARRADDARRAEKARLEIEAVRIKKEKAKRDLEEFRAEIRRVVQKEADDARRARDDERRREQKERIQARIRREERAEAERLERRAEKERLRAERERKDEEVRAERERRRADKEREKAEVKSERERRRAERERKEEEARAERERRRAEREKRRSDEEKLRLDRRDVRSFGSEFAKEMRKYYK